MNLNRTIRPYRQCRRVIWGLLVLVGLLAGSCALPRWDQPDQTFVSDKELAAAALDRQGLEFARQSRYVDAELKFRQALYLFPDADSIKFNLAIVLDQEGLTDEAIAVYNKLIERSPSTIQYQSGLAHSYLTIRDFDSAIDHYKQALDLADKLNDKKRGADAARSLSVVYFLRGDEQSALCYSSLASALDLNDADQMARHVRLLVATGHSASVRDRLKEYIEAHGLKKDPRFNTASAMISFALGDIKESVDRTDVAYDLATGMPELKKDLIVLRKVQEKLLPPAAAAGASPSPSPEQTPDDSEDSNNAKDGIVLDADLISGGASLYWPANLVDELSKLIEANAKSDS